MYLTVKIIIFAVTLVACTGSRSYLVDISALLDEKSDAASQAEVKLKIDTGLRENGVLILTGHGLTSKLASDSFESARKLFELDIAEKLAVSIRNDNTSFGRGYLGFGDESGLSSNFEPKEGYSYGNPLRSANVDEGNLLALPNKWPSALSPEYSQVFNDLYAEKVRVAELIVNALSESFTCSKNDEGREATNSKANDLNAMIRGGHEISLMRLFHYYHQQSTTVQQHLQALQEQRADHHSDAPTTATAPATATAASPSMLGSSPHTDWGFLTLILADEVGGLQFLPKGSNISDESNWVDVPYVPGSLVVNGGDYLKLISRGVYHSPIHRVLSPGSKRPTGSTVTATSSGDEVKDVAQAEEPNATTTTNRVSGSGDRAESSCLGADTCPDRYSFVFFYYPSYSSPVSDSVLSHCTHYLQQNDSSSARQEAVITDVAGESEGKESDAEDVQRTPEPSAPVFNTLLNLEGAAGARPHLFGDYVIQKWKGVYRRVEAY